jgi:hypothetical protein
MLKAYQLAAAFAVVLLFLAMLGIAYYSSPPLNNPSEQRATAEQKFIAQRHEQSIVRPSFWNWLFPDSLSVFTMLLAISTVYSNCSLELDENWYRRWPIRRLASP